MSDFHSTKEWIALAKLHKALCRYYKKWFCVDCGYSGEGLDSDHVLPAKHWKMARLWLCNLELRCGKDTKKKCNQKKGVKLYCTPRTAKLLLYYGGYFIMTKFLYFLLALIIMAVVVDFLYIDYQRGSFDTTIMFQVWGDIVNAWAWIRN